VKLLRGLDMALINSTFGEIIELVTETNKDLHYGSETVRGMTITKEIIPTKANLTGTALDKFIVVRPKEFIYNPRTHGKKIGLGYNNTNEAFIISWNNTAFKVKNEAIELVLPDYLYMYFNRTEWDRDACFRSWGSSTEVFSWESFCEMPISFPSLEIQQKYVDIYLGLQENLDSVNRSIAELENVCISYMEKLIKIEQKKAIGNYIKEVDVRNDDLILQTSDVRGISTQKEFIPTKANMNNISVDNYKVVKPSWFAYVADTSRRGDKMSLAYNDSQDSYLVSSITTVFEVKSEELFPEFLFLFLRRPEFDRYARYNSWGSARETITWEDMGRLEIPIPTKEIQQDIVNIFHARKERADIVDRLTKLQKNICPILIKGAIEEGGR
jgi:type I restriction enzyme S subunit